MAVECGDEEAMSEDWTPEGLKLRPLPLLPLHHSFPQLASLDLSFGAHRLFDVCQAVSPSLLSLTTELSLKRGNESGNPGSAAAVPESHSAAE